MIFWGLQSRAGLMLAATTVAIDQLHKSWMIGFLSDRGRSKIELAPFFDIVMVWNKGVSYGLLKQDSPAGRWALIGFAIVAVLVLVSWLATLIDRLPALGVGFIIGGALSNAIDRIHYGAVADFFSFHAGGYYWYVFNLADAAIVIGVAGLLYGALKSGHKRVGNQT